ncbi:probable glutamyl endopeptidase, chloroplastic [Coccomyxa sp. Obi]|nr:probable glutamyl endopeptidase, chloroplastic [Coccomyxa sp. Obi]
MACTATSNGAVCTDPTVGQRPTAGYMLPPQEIIDLVDVPPEPNLSFSPDRSQVLQLYRPPPLPPISEIARPELKLAGLRIDAQLNAGSRMGYYTGLSIVQMTDDLILPAPMERTTPITGYPEGLWINLVSWSQDGRHIAFTVRSPGGPSDPPRQPLELWVAETATGKARRLLKSPEQGLSSIFDDYMWVDNDTIGALVIPPERGPPPEKPPVPIGPNIQDNTSGKTSQARTYPDLLKSPYDEELFEHYCQSNLIYIKVSTGEVTQLGDTRLYTSFAPSPDARFLLVAWLESPFSYTVPCGRFPKRVQLWDRSGRVLREIAYLPLAEDIPILFNACRQGPRSIDWRSDRDAEITWIEAQDGGDPSVEVSPRDIMYRLPVDEVLADAGAEPHHLAQTDLRCGGIAWGDDSLALLYESWYKTRRSRVWVIAPGDPGKQPQILFDRDYEDAYSDPGSPTNRRTTRGTYVLAQIEGTRQLIMQGTGASPEGNRPFVELLDVDTKETRRLWQSTPPYLEYTMNLLNDWDDNPIRLEDLSLLMTRETVRDTPQYHIMRLSGNGAGPQLRRLSDYPHPYPSLRDLQKEVIRYKREDGLDLTATLYLPPGYDKDRDGRLPCILWAYPREFKTKDAAGQLRKSPYQFSGIGSQSPLLWLIRGYAVLDGPTMPIVAESEDAEPNDTYVPQLVASAKAAVEEVDRRGVVDTARIAVGGHSYGAFMAANLLARAPEMFACGIAKSGAYNRTLTPFGFQAEERTIWQAPEVYATMSPFLQADKIKRPLLLVHGEDDNNTGTFPMQSERFYAALKGHGATTRLVLLPHESHGYSARESVMHVLAEMDAWLRRYCEAPAAAAEEPAAAEQPLSKL